MSPDIALEAFHVLVPPDPSSEGEAPCEANTLSPDGKPASTELTGGAGFTYEDTVVAYHLAQLLRRERAAGLAGVVTSVAVQQQGHGNPMDDLVVESDDVGTRRILGLQIKRSITISGAPTNEEFRGIITAAAKTQALGTFNKDTDKCGFVVDVVTADTLRTLKQLIDWAGASDTTADFEARFASTGTAAQPESNLRDALKPVIGATTVDEEVAFYRNFVAFRFDGLEEAGVLRTDIINRLQELVASNEDGQDLLLFDRLCRIAREGAAKATKWTRASLLSQLRSAVRLKVAPNFSDDVARLNAASLEALNDIAEVVDEFHVPRTALQERARQQVEKYKVVSISGLPGCGKSVVLKYFASEASGRGPILFLKSDRLQGTGWTSFAAALGLRHHSASELLAEIGSAGTPILFVDGIDRIRPDQQHIVTDLIHTIDSDPSLQHWKVLASSRDQGLEAYRAWFPPKFYAATGMGDLTVAGFSEKEAKLLADAKPNLHKVLFSPSAPVREIARRPFFASVLAKALPSGADPQTEVDLIAAWWARAGHDAQAETVPQRQRALIDIAEKGVRNLGKGVAVRDLKDSTVEQIAALTADHIVRTERGGAFMSFTHDIFFEWSFFRLLIELGENWTAALAAAGEPPLLGRVVGLLAQDALTEAGRWTAGYAKLEGANLRAQWRREWLTAPPFTHAFDSATEEFSALLKANDFSLCEKLLVWFQAQHTVPSPLILNRGVTFVEGVDPVRMADLLGWPSDSVAWGRLIDWVIGVGSALPVRLVPHALEVFSVWQNALADFKNPRSQSLLLLCSTWLIELEQEIYDKDWSRKRGKWDALSSEAQKSLATALRTMILRSARAFPDLAVALFERATVNERMLDAAFDDLMGFTPIMAEVAAEAVAKVAEAKLIEELPQETYDRVRREEADRVKWLEELRAIPEEKRTKQQQMALSSPHFPIGFSDFNLDQIGIESHNHYYHPPSALHEPFASLLAKNPKVGLDLIRKLTNHATTGWRQVHRLTRRDNRGTPIPVALDFPWGRQEFWGDWHVYLWGQGMMGAQVLQCAYLALAYWAFNEIEKGRSTSEVIQSVLEGSECYGTLGLCLCLALETYEVSDVTLPIVACQRLWEHDVSRQVQESSKNIDLFGFGFLTKLKGAQAKAKAFLDSRQYRKSNVQELAMRFAISSDDKLRERFKTLLAAFPDNLPYIVEEQRAVPQVTKALKEKAKQWAGLGDVDNYRQFQHGDGVAIAYEPPKPPTKAQKAKLTRSAEYLGQQRALGWATQYLADGKPPDGWTMADAIVFARRHDSKTMFKQRADVGPHAIQSAISAIAACVIRFGAGEDSDRDWAWDVMARVMAMTEPPHFYGAKIPWHPAQHLVVALFNDRKSDSPRADSAARLLQLAGYPFEDIQTMAFHALLADPDKHVQWVAAQLAFDLAHYWKPITDKNGFQRDDKPGREARAKAHKRALAALDNPAEEDFKPLPPAWVKTTQRRGRRSDLDEYWGDPDPAFNGQLAANLFPKFPIEEWCQSDTYRPRIQSLLAQIAQWTSERLMPPWHDGKSRQDKETHLFEWDRALGSMMARAVPFLDLEWLRKNLLQPFLVQDEEALRVLAAFAQQVELRHIVDAPSVPANALPLLHDCVTRVIGDRVFRPTGYRAGEVHGYDMPTLIEALLFVSVEKADGAARFANGDWRDIQIIMPLVTRLVTATGWSTFVMQKFLTLCERAGDAYPLDDFVRQSSAVLKSIDNAKGSWVGTSLPARTAAIIQRLADANYPLQISQARALLSLLDALVDLGDRRAAALEQTEAFRRVQGACEKEQAA